MALVSKAISRAMDFREIGTTKTEYVFNERTGVWEKKSLIVPTTPDSPKVQTTPSNTSTGNSSPSKVDSKAEADKKYIETEFNTLTGELSLTPSKKSLRIKVNDTVEISGVGSYLSGKYFVSAVKRSLTKDGGYSQTLTVMKNGFGDSLKKPKESSDKTNREDAVSKSATSFKVGDSVKIVGNDAVYSNASEGVKVPAWVKQKTLTVKQVSSDGARVLLMPIFSWTYVKYVQKV